MLFDYQSLWDVLKLVYCDNVDSGAAIMFHILL